MKSLFGRSRIMASDECLMVCRHTGPPLIVDGKPVPAPTESFEIKGNVQPLTGLDLMRVPELDRHLERFVVYTPGDRPVELNDRIVRCGINYQVENLETWGRAPSGYQKAIIVRIDVGPNRTP